MYNAAETAEQQDRQDRLSAEERAQQMRDNAAAGLAANPRPQNPYNGQGFVQSPYLNAYMQQNLANQQAVYNNQVAHGQGNARTGDRLAGRQAGQEIFYNDPDMMALRDKYIDLSKGYDGKEMSALRAQKRNQIAGNRNAYMSSLAGKTARAGVGGARGAAIAAAADRGFNQNVAEAERQNTLDQAQMIRSGTKDFADFAMRQKYGLLTSELGEAGLGSNERAAQAARDANKDRGGGLFSGLFSSIGL